MTRRMWIGMLFMVMVGWTNAEALAQSGAAAKAIPVLTQFVSKTGGANLGSLLAGALK